MKEFKIDVSKVDIEDNKFTGYITIDMPNIKERQDFLKEINIANATEISTTDSFDLMGKAGDKIKEIAVSHPDASGVMSDIDELTASQEGTELYQIVCSYVIKGIPLGKTL